MWKRSFETAFILMASVWAPHALSQTALRLYPSASITSDYRYNGVSYSDGEPAVQLSLYATLPEKFYVGVWSSQVDFNDPGHTSYEIDVYAGRTWNVTGSSLAIEAIYTFFPDKSFAGPTYDFLQGKLRWSRQTGRVTFGGQAAWTSQASYASGTAFRTAFDVAYDARSWLEASAHLGRRWIEVGADRSFWDAGMTLRWRKASLDLRYVDTNLDVSRCARSCGTTVVATLTVNL